MIGTPVAEPRTGRPGSGRRSSSVARTPDRLPPVSLGDLADGLIALPTEDRTARALAAEIEARMKATDARSGGVAGHDTVAQRVALEEGVSL
jgi:hypothetical protein